MGIDPASAAPESSLRRRFNFIDDLPATTGRSALEPVLCRHNIRRLAVDTRPTYCPEPSKLGDVVYDATAGGIAGVSLQLT